MNLNKSPRLSGYAAFKERGKPVARKLCLQIHGLSPVIVFSCHLGQPIDLALLGHMLAQHQPLAYAFVDLRGKEMKEKERQIDR